MISRTTKLLALAIGALAVVGTSASIPSVSSSLSKPQKQSLKVKSASLAPASITSTTDTSTRGGAGQSSAVVARLQTLKVGFYFALWYALNIYYNSKSKENPILCTCSMVPSVLYSLLHSYRNSPYFHIQSSTRKSSMSYRRH
jgi:hypothetical protein